MFLSLQMYRGLAAVAVAAFHLSIALGDPRYLGTKVFDTITWRMDLGVDFFFVLSGFIILQAHAGDLGRPERLPRFLLKRFVRIYPTYWIYTGGFCLLVALGFGSVTANPSTPAEWLTVVTLIRFENFLLPISPAWTLIHEVAFYLAFALAILHRSLGLLVFALWQLACALLFSFPAPDERTAAAVYLSAYNLDFAIGMGCFVLMRSGRLHAPRLWMLAGVALVALVLVFEAGGTAFSGVRFLYALAFGAIILASVQWERRAPWRVPALLLLLGNASFSIYLTHTPVQGLMAKIVLRVLPPGLAEPHLVYGLVLVSTVAAGCIAYLLVERPVLKLTRALFETRGSPGRPAPLAKAG